MRYSDCRSRGVIDWEIPLSIWNHSIRALNRCLGKIPAIVRMMVYLQKILSITLIQVETILF